MEDDLINNAISIHPRMVRFAVSNDPKFESKVHEVWVDSTQDRFFIFRDSSRVPGQFSKDIYQYSTRQRIGKDEKKYSSLPILPEGAIKHILANGTHCSSMTTLDPKFLANLSTGLKLD